MMRRFIAIATAVFVMSCWFLIDGTSSSKEALGQNDVQRQAPSVPRKDTIILRKCFVELIDRATIASDRPGILAFVEPEEGDFVVNRQEVARLKDHDAVAAYNTALRKTRNNVQIRFAEKAALVAEKEWEISADTNIRLPRTTPQVEIEKLKLAFEKSILQIEQAKEDFAILGLQLEEAKVQLDTFRIEAPLEGMVVKVYKYKGEAVRQGEEILEIVSTRRVKVKGYVGIADIWYIKPGAPVTVRLDLPGIDRPEEKLEFQGRIKFVDVSVNKVTSETSVWAEVINRDSILRPGLRATMSIHLSKQVARKR